MKILSTRYKDLDAVSVETGSLSAVFLPRYGGKLASLVDGRTGREFLVQAPDAQYHRLAYDGDYVAAECSGCDDMFPTIDVWYYDRFPWQGTRMPDHGEVAGLPWSFETDGNGRLHMWVSGVRFPYRLDKWISAQEGSLMIEYSARNFSMFDMDFLWAAHMMLNAESDAEIFVPYGDSASATTVFTFDTGFGHPGDKLVWPHAVRRDGNPVDLRRVGERNPKGNNYKYYFDEPMPKGRFGYYYPSDGAKLTIEVPEDKVPYLSFWVNEGSFKDFFNVAPEPCTGAYDQPGAAKAHKQASILPADGCYQWYMRLSVTKE
jgi:hypothetical protein